MKLAPGGVNSLKLPDLAQSHLAMIGAWYMRNKDKYTDLVGMCKYGDIDHACDFS